MATPFIDFHILLKLLIWSFHITQTCLFSLPLNNVHVLGWLAVSSTGSLCKTQVRESVPSKQATTERIIALEWACNDALPEWAHKEVE